MHEDEFRKAIIRAHEAWANPRHDPLAPTFIPQRLYDELIKRYPGYANNQMIQPAKVMPHA